MNHYPHYGTFQKATRQRNEGGGSGEVVWNDFLTTECHVQPVSSSEYMQAQQLQAPIDHNIFYPFQEGVTADMRFVWHDRDKTIDLKSDPLDQGGMGKVYLIKGRLDGTQ